MQYLPTDQLQPNTAVQIAAVSKNYGSFAALNDVSLTVTKGEKIVICGPSGSGKSTLIRCINQLERHDRGNIVVCGKAIDGHWSTLHQIRQEVGMVFQSFNLFPHMTVLQNCTMAPMDVKGLKPAEAEALAYKYLSQVRIADQAKKYPSQLSGGQQQRVAIARAMCMRPSVLLLDEPTSALDPEMVREVLDAILGLATEGMTMICVTHEMGFAREMADRVIFMDKGSIVEENPPAAFFSAPKTQRARDFLSQIFHHDADKTPN